MEADRLDLGRPDTTAGTIVRQAGGTASACPVGLDYREVGRELNRVAMSLNKHVNRVLFKRDEITYLARFDLTEEQRQAVINRDGHELQRLGGNLFSIMKIMSFDPIPVAPPGAGREFWPQAKFERDILDRR